MRSSIPFLALCLSALTSSLVACAPAEDEAEDSNAAVSGGSTTVESAVVFLFDPSAAPKATPACVGTLLGDTVAVTAKACAKEGLVVGRAADKDGKRKQAKVTKVHVPTSADAEIAIIEIDKAIGGTPARLTNAPLREDYAINSFAAADTGGLKGIFSPDKGEASTIKGRLASETDAVSTVVPNKGKQICAGDLGAAVCSSTSLKVPVLHKEIFGTCGLSGIIVGPETTSTAPSADACSSDGWKMAQLGRYADFIRQYAPDAFKPIKFARIVPIAPSGLWGYKTGGTVSKCQIETAKVDPILVGADSTLRATATFANLGEKSTQFGRFGIATKDAPKMIRWFPARVASTNKVGKDIEMTFEGAVPGIAAGEYLVSFRASATSGETWTQCDLDGLENGFDADKLVGLTVNPPPTANETPTTPTAPANETPSAAPEAPASDTGNYDYADVTSDDADTASDDYGYDEDPSAPKSKPAASGCSVGTSGTTNAGLPALGLLLGVAAFVRRKR